MLSRRFQLSSRISAQKLGYKFEEYIHAHHEAINIKCIREKDIRKLYKLGGIDHIFQSLDKVVFVQAKWTKAAPTPGMAPEGSNPTTENKY